MQSNRLTEKDAFSTETRQCGRERERETEEEDEERSRTSLIQWELFLLLCPRISSEKRIRRDRLLLLLAAYRQQTDRQTDLFDIVLSFSLSLSPCRGNEIFFQSIHPGQKREFPSKSVSSVEKRIKLRRMSDTLDCSSRLEQKWDELHLLDRRRDENVCQTSNE